MIPEDDRDVGGLHYMLIVSKGTRVMLLRNLCTAYGLINGAEGTVVEIITNNVTGIIQFINVQFDDLQERIPLVACQNNGSVAISRYKQEFMSNGRLIVREMFPLTPCWAATVHKVQGLSLQSAVISLDQNIFQHGQAYVALSRVFSLEQLQLLTICFDKITADPEVVNEYLRLYEIYQDM